MYGSAPNGSKSDSSWRLGHSVWGITMYPCPASCGCPLNGRISYSSHSSLAFYGVGGRIRTMMIFFVAAEYKRTTPSLLSRRTNWSIEMNLTSSSIRWAHRLSDAHLTHLLSLSIFSALPRPTINVARSYGHILGFLPGGEARTIQRSTYWIVDQRLTSNKPSNQTRQPLTETIFSI